MSQTLPPLKIGKHLARYPIVQGGMAVKVAGAKLAGAIANAGGIGIVSSAGLGLTPFEISECYKCVVSAGGLSSSYYDHQ